MTEIIFDENIDWETRVLCSDESCIGTIGPDGKCRGMQQTLRRRSPGRPR